MKKNILLLAAACLATISAAAQTEAQCAGYYYNYPGVPADYRQTPPPEGYEPFYLSHYGRHGSRFLTSIGHYDFVIALLESRPLSAFGRNVLSRMQAARRHAEGNDGQLSQLGARQHREIAARMYSNFPTLLGRPVRVEAISSTAMRCALSMANCCMELRALNPALQISMESSARYMPILVNKDAVVRTDDRDSLRHAQYLAFTDSILHPQRFVQQLFDGGAAATADISAAQGRELMQHCWHIFADMQNVPELGLSFADLFTPDELQRLWQWDNAEDLDAYGIVTGCSARYHRNSRRIVEHIVAKADSVIATGTRAVSLRFGHDTNLASLAYLLQLSGCNGTPANFRDAWKLWRNYEITPMAANLQVVFYRGARNDFRGAGSEERGGRNEGREVRSEEREVRSEEREDILVKFLYNETERTIPIATDIPPYYHWRDVRQWLLTLP